MYGLINHFITLKGGNKRYSVNSMQLKVAAKGWRVQSPGKKSLSINLFDLTQTRQQFSTAFVTETGGTRRDEQWQCYTHMAFHPHRQRAVACHRCLMSLVDSRVPHPHQVAYHRHPEVHHPLLLILAPLLLQELHRPTQTYHTLVDWI